MSDLSVNLKSAILPAAQTSAPALSEDRRLMNRLANGEEAAMCELIQKHGETLARLIGRLTAWHGDRDDILQEVLVNVWQKSASFRGDGPLEGWLKRIAVNQCRNHFRAANGVKRMMGRFARLLTPAETVDPAPVESSAADKVNLALGALSNVDRTALVLFYLEGMTGDEVATAMKIKLETLHVRLHRARKNLKQAIEAQEESDD